MVAFIGGIGGWEILIVLAFALVIFGPQRLPELARGIGKISAQIRAANRQLQRELYENLDPEEIRRPSPASPAARSVERDGAPGAPDGTEAGPGSQSGEQEKAPGDNPGAANPDGGGSSPQSS